MAKKPKKTLSEKTAENYFPIDESDAKYTTEKLVKNEKPSITSIRGITEKPVKSTETEQIIRKSVEKPNKKPDRKSLITLEKPKKPKKRTIRKKAAAKKKQAEEFKPPKIKLKENGYELIITEKPQAALKIAAALGRSTKKDHQKIPYYDVDRNGKRIVVTCAVGHLFTLSQLSKGSEIPRFDIGWVPNYLVRKRDFTKKYYEAIKKLVKDASNITVATDYDVEGEVIGLNVVRFICGQPDAKRMKFSTLTKDELNKAYENKEDTINWGQAIAGETRHYLDWFYGINLSRALMNAIKTTGKFKIMSIGRVQGPALDLIVKKEREIQKFKSEPYWEIFIKVDDDKNQLELKHNKKITDKKDLEDFKDLVGKTAECETKKNQQELPPNPPFDLTTLQTEAYKLYGITPSNTLKAAQSLYLAGLISYPRTSSQKLPASIGYEEILKKLIERYKVKKYIKNKKPVEGKKEDPAHPSIYPTAADEIPILSGDQEKIYDLIVKRFLSLFCENALIDNKTIRAEKDKKIYSTRGSAIARKAWLAIYPSKLKEVEVPDMSGTVNIIDSRIEEKETQPPRRYSPASIISELEKRNLGTKATRSSILETLQDRGYIQGQSLSATPLGLSLIESLEKYSPIIIDEKLTRSFEDQMENINHSKDSKDAEKKEKNIIEKAKKTITEISEHFEKHKKSIGSALVDANVKLREQQKIENRLNVCPKCQKGHLGITYSRKTKRHFVACDAYPECKNTFSLPPNGIIKKTDKVCEECGFPQLMRLSKGKRPWIFCFNPECQTNKERLEEYKKKQEGYKK